MYSYISFPTPSVKYYLL